MLTIYSGRASLDTEAFLFQSIGSRLEAIRRGDDAAKRILLVVPAQYTLKAEEAAFAHLPVQGFFDLQIMSGHRLMHRIFHETGRSNRVTVDQFGRTLLLRTVLKDVRDSLDTFSALTDSDDFISLLSRLIAQLKQGDLSAGDVEAMRRHVDPDSLLARKLQDIHKVYEAYERTLEGKWIDTEDVLSEAAERAVASELITTSEIWYHDFYSFTAREIRFLGSLMRTAQSLSVVLSGTFSDQDPDAALFRPTKRTAEALCRHAEELGIPHRKENIPVAFSKADRPKALQHIERQLFVQPPEIFSEDAPIDSLTLINASHPYSECLTIASDILRLCGERGYLPQDIAVLTNDLQERGPLLRRTFAEHGIPYFFDEKRSVLHHPLIRTITNLIDAVADNRPAASVLGLLKASLVSDAETDDEQAPIEDFENYVLQYHIRGDRFRKPFLYGERALGEPALQALERRRASLDGLLSPLEKDLQHAATVRDKSAALYRFLSDMLQVETALERQAQELDAEGAGDAAQETRQMWNLFIDLMDQTVELLGERTATTEEYRDIVATSFADVTVGLLPQAEASVLIGTVGRTRLPDVRALFIAGVNDGLLPAGGEGEGLLTDRELVQLEELGFSPAKDRERASEEEQLLIYQAVNKPSEQLSISYARADAAGRETRPSPLVAQLKALFPALPVLPDVTHESREEDRYLAHIPAALHLTAEMQRYLSGESKQLSGQAQLAYDFLLKRAPETAATIRNGLFYSITQPPLSPDTVQSLYHYDPASGQYAFSPTRLEAFAECPFKHSITYGLLPRPRRPFEMTGREIGDIYHECLMRITEDLRQEAESKGLSVTHPDSPWMTISRQECDDRVERTLETLRTELFEGLLDFGKAEAYRTDRLANVAKNFVWQVVGHVRKGRIDRILTEVRFGRGGEVPALTIPLAGRQVLVEGYIDRIDLLAADDAQPLVKIIDYKSGQADFNRDLIVRGLQLQLMVYLESALAVHEEAEPVGMFYCYIQDPTIESNSAELAEKALSQEIVSTIEARYRMEGMFVDDPALIERMDGSLEDGDRSTVIPVQKKDNAYRSTRAISREDFQAFRSEFQSSLADLCDRLTRGAAEVDPQRLGRNRTACTYCDYQSICLYDITKGLQR